MSVKGLGEHMAHVIIPQRLFVILTAKARTPCLNNTDLTINELAPIFRSEWMFEFSYRNQRLLPVASEKAPAAHGQHRATDDSFAPAPCQTRMPGSVYFRSCFVVFALQESATNKLEKQSMRAHQLPAYPYDPGKHGKPLHAEAPARRGPQGRQGPCSVSGASLNQDERNALSRLVKNGAE
jgi:hypothetical protein